MTLAAVERAPAWWCVAVSGSTTWRLKWFEPLYRDLDNQLDKLSPGDTFVLRHGGANKGADRIAHEWFALRKALSHGVTMIEEIVAADWTGPCVTTPYKDVRGNIVRACPQGHRRFRKDGGEFCPAKGQHRNIEVPAHPNFPVDLLLAYCVDDSAGTSKTVGWAKKYKISYHLSAYYPRTSATPSTARDGRGPLWAEGDSARAGSDLQPVELEIA